MTYYTAKDLADSFRTVRKNTIIVAEEIPESTGRSLAGTSLAAETSAT
jgi:hypothetical protein